MPRIPIVTYFDAEQIQRIDQAVEDAKAKGERESRSEFVRRAVDQALAGQKEE